jgi:Cu2+-exporting ATPase
MSTQTFHSPEKATCSFCGLALPSKPVKGKDGKVYCCPGCAHVDEIVSVVGNESERGKKAIETAQINSLLSAPLEEECKVELDDSVKDEARLHLKNLACPSCGWLVERVLKQTEGVADASVDYYSDSAHVTFDLSSCSVDSLVEAVNKTGYVAEEYSLKGSSRDVKEMIRLAFAFFIAMNQMMLAWVGYDVIFPDSGGGFEPIVAWIQLLSALPVVVWCALPLYKRAWMALKRGSVVMETLLSLGIISSVLISATAFISHHDHLYFESATMLVALSLAGRHFENWIKHKTSASLTNILEFSPTKARLGEDGSFKPLADVTPGTTIRILKGETVPMDIILAEEGIVREGLLTGESHAVRKPRGSIVLAGSVADSEHVEGKVYREAKASMAEVIKDRVLTALRRVDSGSRLADRLAQGFVPLVVIVAIVAFVLHYLGGAAIDRAALIGVSVLVVSCPCAFGIAASSALSLGVLSLAKHGVLIKEPKVLESAVDLNEMYFDKTGTVTAGALQIEAVGWIEEEIPGLLEKLQSIEKESKHPIGIALATLLPEDKSIRTELVVEVVGMGITGTVDNKRYAIGKAELFENVNRPLPSRPDNASRVWFGLAGEVPAGYLDIADTVKPEAKETIEEIHSMGIKTGLLSGDGSGITVTIAEILGIDNARGDLKPEDKAAYITERKDQNKTVAFVGDGFNDAPALAEADIGIAMSSGADLAMISSPIVFTRPTLKGLTLFMSAARRARKVLASNFTWAFIYNVAMIPVAALGWLLPIHAALLMALSSTSVALNSVRVRKGFQTGD